MNDDSEKYLIVEPDFSGWNNVRMCFETALVMAIAMGRTLVLPRGQQMRFTVKGAKSVFDFHSFFHLDAMMKESTAFKYVTMEEFLEKDSLRGRLRDKHNNIVRYPPGNATHLPKNGIGHHLPIFKYL